MKTREVLAVAGIAAVAGGSLEAANEFDANATAQALYITTKTCVIAYDAPSGTEGRGGGGESGPNLLDVTADGTPAQLAAFTLGGGPSNPWVVTKQTLNCLKAGAWIPGGAAVDASTIKAGSPERLLRGYAELEKTDEDFNPSSTLIGALFSGGLGGIIAAAYRRRKQHNQENPGAAEA